MIHPAVLAFWAYALAAIVVCGWTASRDGFLVPAAVVFNLWLLGIAVQLGIGADVPTWVFLAADLCAFAWFLSRREAGAFVFALTFGAQVVLELAAGLFPDPLSWWWAHWATAMVQLAVLFAWCKAVGCGRG